MLTIHCPSRPGPRRRSLTWIGLLILLQLPSLASLGLAQSIDRGDPLGQGRLLMPSDELVVLQSQSAGAGYTLREMLYDGNGPLDTTDLALPGLRSSLGVTVGTLALDVAVGQFSAEGESDPRAEWISAFEGVDRNIVLTTPYLDRDELEILGANSLAYSPILSSRTTPYRKLPGVRYAPSLRVIRTAAGDVDGDGLDEFVLAARHGNDDIWVWVYDVTGDSTTPAALDLGGDTYVGKQNSHYFQSARPCSQGLAYAPAGSANFDLVVADVDSDGVGEIVIADISSWCSATGAQGTDRWTLTPRVMAYELSTPFDDPAWAQRAAGSITGSQLAANRARPTGVWSGSTWSRISLESGDVDADGVEELVLAYGSDRGRAEVVTFEYEPYETYPEFNGRFVAGTPVSLQDVDPDCSCDRGPFTVVAADVDGLGQAEIVAQADDRLWILGHDEESGVIERDSIELEGSADSDYSHRTISVADLDLNSGGLLAKEILVAEGIALSIDEPGRIAYLRWDESTGLSRVGSQPIDSGASATGIIGRIAMRSLNLNGDGAKLSVPECITVQDVIQPLVVLNAPPIHFDAVDRRPSDGSCFDASGAIQPGCFDVNYCYPNDAGVDCDFTSTYRLTETTEVTSEIRSDWATSSSRTISGGVTLETPYVQASVDTSLTRGVGERFENVQGAGSTISTSIDVTAIRTDLVLVSEGSYDVCEYEVSVAVSPDPIGHVVVAMPQVLQTRWREPAKYPSDALLLNGHEAGNLLSYPLLTPVQANDLTLLPEVARPLATFDPVPVGISGSSFGFTVDFSDFESESLAFESRQNFSSSTSVSASGGFSVGFVDATASIGVQVDGSYSSGEMSTHRTSISTSQSFEVGLGQLDGSVLEGGGSPAYDIQPFVYWNQNGSLVLDYSVDLDLPGSFWRNYYGAQPDLSFHLPWRHDRAKGISSTPIAETENSPDILISPKRLAPGESFDLSVRVQNYSLALSRPAATPLRVYLGDPRQGGVVLDTGEVFEVAPDARESEVVEIRGLRIPSNANLADPRIFVELDPDGQVVEIHENNNLAWSGFLPVPEPGVALGLFGGVLWLAGFGSARRRAKAAR